MKKCWCTSKNRFIPRDFFKISTTCRQDFQVDIVIKDFMFFEKSAKRNKKRSHHASPMELFGSARTSKSGIHVTRRSRIHLLKRLVVRGSLILVFDFLIQIFEPNLFLAIFVRKSFKAIKWLSIDYSELTIFTDIRRIIRYSMIFCHNKCHDKLDAKKLFKNWFISKTVSSKIQPNVFISYDS